MFTRGFRKKTNKKQFKTKQNKTKPYFPRHNKMFTRDFRKKKTIQNKTKQNSYRVKTYIKPRRKLKEIMCKPKDRLEPKEVSGPVHKFVCGGGRGVECNETYIGETERSFKPRFLEHKRPSCASS